MNYAQIYAYGQYASPDLAFRIKNAGRQTYDPADGMFKAASAVANPLIPLPPVTDDPFEANTAFYQLPLTPAFVDGRYHICYHDVSAPGRPMFADRFLDITDGVADPVAPSRYQIRYQVEQIRVNNMTLKEALAKMATQIDQLTAAVAKLTAGK